jgi:hypothetical protein
MLLQWCSHWSSWFVSGSGSCGSSSWVGESVVKSAATKPSERQRRSKTCHAPWSSCYRRLDSHVSGHQQDQPWHAGQRG